MYSGIFIAYINQMQCVNVVHLHKGVWWSRDDLIPIICGYATAGQVSRIGLGTSLAFVVEHNSEESEEMFLYCTAQPDVAQGLSDPFRPVFELEPIDTDKYIPSLTNMQAYLSSPYEPRACMHVS
jgi:hypothetical protein